MSFAIQLSTLFILLLYKALGEECCDHKTVGPFNYTFVETSDLPAKYDCLNDCLYSRDGEDNPETLYCFARGHLPVECYDQPETVCPYGWSQIQQKCYKLFTTPTTWEEASAECSKISGASLASIDNEAQQQFAYGLLREYTSKFGQAWLGGSVFDTEGVWEWQSSGAIFAINNTAVPGVYNNFANGQPGQGQGLGMQDDCLYMTIAGGGWYAGTCNNLGAYHFCEVPASVPVSDCPSGWWKIQQKCFKISNTPTTWERASTECSKIPGASFASLDNEVQHQLVQGISGGETIWLGGSDSATEGTFVWQNSGTAFTRNNTPVPGVYTNFIPGRLGRNTNKTNCLQKTSYPGGNWAPSAYGSNPCDWILRYLCEITSSVSGETSSSQSAEPPATIPPPTPGLTSGCPSGWSRIQQKCLKVSDNIKLWTEASTECSKISGGSLASIDNEAEQQFVNGLNQGEWLWLGGSDSAIEGTWVWEDSGIVFAINNTAIPGVYNNFYTDKAGPSTKTEKFNCLILSPYKGLWWQFGCKANYKYICEVPASVSGK